MTQNDNALVAGQITHVPLSTLTPDPDQPRKNFDKKSLKQLAQSIVDRGVLVPIIVRESSNGELVIYDGERRYRAAQIAEQDEVPVLLMDGDISEEDIRVDQLAVNNIREKLSKMEVARMLASLRREKFASVNDLSAHLARAGLPPMKPKEIEQAIQLCDLPKAVQNLIDADQLEPAAASKLRALKKYPAAMKAAISELKEDIDWRGKATVHEARVSAVKGLYEAGGVSLTKTHSWYGDKAVHFNYKTACKGCEHLVTVGGEAVCMSPKDFQEKNGEAKAAGLLPGGEKPKQAKAPNSGAPSEKEVEQKGEQRQQSLREKCRDYLHDYLVSRIIEKMQGDIDITDELLAWHAMERPGPAGWWRKPAISMDYKSSKQAGIGSIEDLLAAKSTDFPKLCAAIEVAHSLPWRETQVICRELWGRNIEAVWTIEAPFLELFRKAELLHLVELHQLEQPEGKPWDKLKVPDLRAAILACGIDRPAILQEIYDDVEAPYIPWGERDLDDEDDDEGQE